MWQTIITLLILGVALFFIGRKLYNQIRNAVDPSRGVSCGCSGGCGSCNVSCDSNPGNSSNQDKPE